MPGWPLSAVEEFAASYRQPWRERGAITEQNPRRVVY